MLSLGVMGGDTRNAPPVDLYSQGIHDKLTAMVASYNSNPKQYATTADLAEAIIANIYTETLTYPGQRYNAINLDHLTRDGGWNKNNYGVDSPVRMELRSNYMPQNVDQMIASFTLIAARLAYLSSQTGPIVFTGKPIQDTSFHSWGMQGGLSMHDAADQYTAYLKEMGMNLNYFAQNNPNPDFKEYYSQYVTKLISESSSPFNPKNGDHPNARTGPVGSDDSAHKSGGSGDNTHPAR